MVVTGGRKNVKLRYTLDFYVDEIGELKEDDRRWYLELDQYHIEDKGHQHVSLINLQISLLFYKL